MSDKASLLPETVSPFVFLLLLLNVEACKDKEKTKQPYLLHSFIDIDQ